MGRAGDIVLSYIREKGRNMRVAHIDEVVREADGTAGAMVPGIRLTPVAGQSVARFCCVSSACAMRENASCSSAATGKARRVRVNGRPRRAITTLLLPSRSLTRSIEPAGPPIAARSRSR